ncbi:hypothetical protein GQ42DRAFT_29327 [Ramicandelaber brevisporus]|nr:hypothetical protein GQ42DRAFT_29327 [Ramicandelaber brevisporus]
MTNHSVTQNTCREESPLLPQAKSAIRCRPVTPDRKLRRKLAQQRQLRWCIWYVWRRVWLRLRRRLRRRLCRCRLSLSVSLSVAICRCWRWRLSLSMSMSMSMPVSPFL